jgi:alanyl-tRNA synthetase
VDVARRRNIERNHSATHLVHAALRKHLGTHVRQQGSLVDDAHLRFDFSHHGPIEPGVLQAIEREVNAHIWANIPVTTREMAYPDAIALGAMALFSEKYGDRVRVVFMGESSIELCGGTHVRSTGQVGLFQFSSQGGVAAGVRRIEAVTGPEAYTTSRRSTDSPGRGRTQGAAGAPAPKARATARGAGQAGRAGRRSPQGRRRGAGVGPDAAN